MPGNGEPDPRARVAMAIPTANGTATARTSHPSRTVQDGTKAGMGMKARTSASTPIPSTAAWAGTTTAPPSPAMKQPMANAWI